MTSLLFGTSSVRGLMIMCLLMKRASSLPIAVRHVTCGGFGNMSKHLALSFPCLISSNSSWIPSLSLTSTPDVVSTPNTPKLSPGVVWKYITDRNLNGAHDSMVDVVAQLDVISHEYYLPYLNMTNSLRLIQHVLSQSKGCSRCWWEEAHCGGEEGEMQLVYYGMYWVWRASMWSMLGKGVW